MTDVDYLNKTATLDKPLPAKLLDGQFFEVGMPAQDGHDEHWTTYEAVSVKPQAGNQTILEWRKGADDYARQSDGRQGPARRRDRHGLP